MNHDNIDYLKSGKLAFSVSPSKNGFYPWALVLLDLLTGELRYLVDYSRGAIVPKWSPDGKYLLYSFDLDCNGIFAFDLEKNEVRRIDGGQPPDGDGDCQAAWSPNGKQIAYMSHRDSVDFAYEIEITDLEGEYRRRLTNQSGGYPIWSPDGEWIVYYSPRRDLQHFRIHPDGSQDERFIELPDPTMRVRMPSWHADRKTIIFTSWLWEPGNYSRSDLRKSQLWVADADGKNARLIHPDRWFECTPIPSPSSGVVAVLGNYDEAYGNASIYLLENGELRELVKQTYSEGYRWNMWSPDGRYIAYAPFHGRTMEGTGIYILEVATGRVQQVSDLLAAYPVWCPVV